MNQVCICFLFRSIIQTLTIVYFADMWMRKKMWIFFTSLWSGGLGITCLDAMGQSVDWFVKCISCASYFFISTPFDQYSRCMCFYFLILFPVCLSLVILLQFMMFTSFITICFMFRQQPTILIIVEQADEKLYSAQRKQT